MTIERTSFREAMARLGAAVSVITTVHDGVRDGFTASAVCSVSDEPATLLVCINRSSRSRSRFNRNGPLCVNVLAGDQSGISDRFAAKHDPEAKFSVGEWTTLETGAPVLYGALANFDCFITDILEIGTHSVMFCEVEGTKVGPNQRGLMYLDRAYHNLPHEARG